MCLRCRFRFWRRSLRQAGGSGPKESSGVGGGSGDVSVLESTAYVLLVEVVVKVLGVKIGLNLFVFLPSTHIQFSPSLAQSGPAPRHSSSPSNL